MGVAQSTLVEQGQTLAELMKLLQGVDEDGSLAQLNETTISDNNGGRITL